MPTEAFEHICEVCGLTETLTPEQSFDAGWDYPPNMGARGIISPRTCGDCGIENTVWWALTVDHISPDDLSETQIEVIERILSE